MRKYSNRLISCVILVSALTTGLVMAGNELATLTPSANGISVTSSSSYALDVTVAGPGSLLIQQRLPAGESAYLQREGGLPDGQYRYEIRIIPSTPPSSTTGTGMEEASDGRSVSTKPPSVTGSTIQAGGFRLAGGTQLAPTVEAEE